MTFRSYFTGLDADARADYAKSVGSTVGYLLQVAYENKRVELGLADVMVAVANGAITLADLPLTDRAIDQDRRRKIVRVIGAAPASLEGERRAA